MQGSFLFLEIVLKIDLKIEPEIGRENRQECETLRGG